LLFQRSAEVFMMPRVWLVSVLLTTIATGELQAQKPASAASLADMSLDELVDVKVVSAARHEQDRFDSPRAISVVTAEMLRRGNYRTVPEALNELPGVFVQETNYAGGSPIVRGLIGNQVLLLVDGVRLNDATYRLGPNQYLNTVDINSVERIEVIHGPGSVLYGSDALGGVINIITKSRVPGAGRAFEARLAGRGATADGSGVGRVEMSGGIGSLDVTGGFSLKSFSDLTGGHATGLQPFTGYDERDGDVRLAFAVSPRQRFTASVQSVHQDDVPRTDMLRAGTDLEYEWNPEIRTLGQVSYVLDRPGSFLDSLSLSASYQVQSERFNRITSAKPSVERQQDDDVRSTGVVAQFSSTAPWRQLFTYGAEYYHDAVASTRTDVTIQTGARKSEKGTFADGATYQSAALFVQDEVEVSTALSLVLGLRYNQFRLDADSRDASAGSVTVHSRPKALTGSAYAQYRLTPHVSVVGGAAQGFRAPNVDDSTIFGSSSAGFEVPAPGLAPERSLNVEGGIRVQHPAVIGDVRYFESWFDGLIQRQLATFRDLPFMDLNGNGVRDPKEESVYQRQNLGSALIRGVEAQAQGPIARGWEWRANLGWCYGEDSVAGDPLRRIPPLKGVVAVRWSSRRGAWVEGYSILAGRQDRLAPGDLTDPRISRTGTPAFATVNLRGGLEVTRRVRVTLGAENLLDASYRLHGSGIDAPGRTLVVGAEWRFSTGVDRVQHD
jgi:hemoglobin/transferrin/lactoferrin receptor protein